MYFDDGHAKEFGEKGLKKEEKENLHNISKQGHIYDIKSAPVLHYVIFLQKSVMDGQTDNTPSYRDARERV